MTGAARAHLARFVLLLLAVVVVNFFLPRVLPGSPFSGGTGESAVVLLPAGAQADLRRMYLLDRPVGEQFTAYLLGLRRGDLGRSIATHRRVTEMIAARLPWTLFLVGSAVLLSVAIGGALGTVAAWRPGRPLVRLGGPLLIGLGALPEFLVGMALIVLLGVGLPLFPLGGAITPFRDVTGIGGWVSAAGDLLWHAALPAMTLVLGLVPAFYLLSRNALVPVVGAPYLLAARGKGLSDRRVLGHAWRNALPPVLTLLGLRLAFVVTGTAVVERIFAYPGMGLLMFEAVGRRDYPVMQGIFLVSGVIVLGVNLALDLTASVLDPRTRRAEA